MLRSSANDLARFVAMLLSDGEPVLPAEAVARLWQELHVPEGGSGQTTQGLLWMRLFGGSIYGHSGYDFGANTFVFLSPGWRLGGVVLINADGPGSQQLRDQSLQALTDAMRALR